MRLEDNQTLVLSRKNLLTLLAKLDGYPEDSQYTILGGDEAPGILVKAEENEVHYAHREAGIMHTETEAHIRGLKI